MDKDKRESQKMSGLFEIEKLHEKVWVFKNAFSMGNDMIKYYQNNFPDDWIGWYGFGSHILIPLPGRRYESFPTQEEWDLLINDVEDEKAYNVYVKELMQNFYDATKKYCEELNVDLGNWCWQSIDIACYKDGFGVNEKQGMNYHTDFQEERKDEPGYKFGITSLFYLNDDYDGGGIRFIILNDDRTELLESFSYKPSAGDILVFPSRHPFYHSSDIAKNGIKHLVRTYWRYEFDGTQEFLEERSKYSEEDWEPILKERQKSKSLEVGQILNRWNDEV
jgi:hypothetical protein